jgi:hypothetical protein
VSVKLFQPSLICVGKANGTLENNFKIRHGKLECLNTAIGFQPLFNQGILTEGKAQYN